MDGIVDAYFDKDIRILVSDPEKVTIAGIKDTLAKHDIKPSLVAQVGSI